MTTCKAAEKILAIQKQCAVCAKTTKDGEEDCEKCGGIKYCSAKCKLADK
jgi:hypothetical protein